MAITATKDAIETMIHPCKLEIMKELFMFPNTKMRIAKNKKPKPIMSNETANVFIKNPFCF
ncbi:MAG: hypothetical protein PHN69_01905 [Candidatus Pacebacteria bacterium]|nr:hypothetical protein [Candidatus Paceibacterota bacterium]